MLKFNKREWIDSVVSRRERMFLPVMASPGAELLGARHSDVFRDGELQFRCIAALSDKVRADMRVTFMDLSVEAEAFGGEVVFPEGGVPAITGEVASSAELIEALKVPAVGQGRTGETLKCMRMCAEKLGVPVLGGVIGPFSLASRLAGMTEMMVMTAVEPESAHMLLEKASAFLVVYMEAVRDTGIAGVMIAEPAAGLISPEMCEEFSSSYVKRMVDRVRSDDFLVVLHNCGRTEKQLDSMAGTGADAIHVGNAVEMTEILRLAPPGMPVIGNLDPAGVLKMGTPESVYEESKRMLEKCSGFRNYVFSSGCDLAPGTPIDNILAMERALRDYNSGF